MVILGISFVRELVLFETREFDQNEQQTTNAAADDVDERLEREREGKINKTWNTTTNKIDRNSIEFEQQNADNSFCAVLLTFLRVFCLCLFAKTARKKRTFFDMTTFSGNIVVCWFSVYILTNSLFP